MAYIEEGVAIIIDVIEYPGVIADWGHAMLAGTPVAIIAIVGILFILIGSFGALLVFPLANVVPTDPFFKRLALSTGGFVGFYFLSFLFVLIFNKWLVLWRGIALGSCVGLVLILTAIHKPLFKPLDKIAHIESSEISWTIVGVSLGIAATFMTVQMLTFYLI